VVGGGVMRERGVKQKSHDNPLDMVNHLGSFVLGG